MNGSGKCTVHDYEGLAASLNITIMDNSPAWCGSRYSMLNIARITAVHGLNTPGKCNQCLKITGENSINQQPVYVLAVDQKGDPGLDIAKSSFQKIFPDKNWLDPQICHWEVVDSSFCSGICVGTATECDPGSRNLLPAYLLPKMTYAKKGFIDVDDKSESKVSTESRTVSVNPNSTIIHDSNYKINSSTLKRKQSKITAVSSKVNVSTSTQSAGTTTINAALPSPQSYSYNSKPSNYSSTATKLIATTLNPASPAYYYDGNIIRLSGSTLAKQGFPFASVLLYILLE